MQEFRIDFEGAMRCRVLGEKFGKTELITDSSESEDAYSPSDLLTISLGTSVASLMGSVARKRHILLKGMRVTAMKTMSEDEPHRVEKIKLELHVPLSEDHQDCRLLQAAARSCPVRHSIHPDIQIDMEWHWK